MNINYKRFNSISELNSRKPVERKEFKYAAQMFPERVLEVSQLSRNAVGAQGHGFIFEDLIVQRSRFEGHNAILVNSNGIKFKNAPDVTIDGTDYQVKCYGSISNLKHNITDSNGNYRYQNLDGSDMSLMVPDNSVDALNNSGFPAVNSGYNYSDIRDIMSGTDATFDWIKYSSLNASFASSTVVSAVLNPVLNVFDTFLKGDTVALKPFVHDESMGYINKYYSKFKGLAKILSNLINGILSNLFSVLVVNTTFSIISFILISVFHNFPLMKEFLPNVSYFIMALPIAFAFIRLVAEWKNGKAMAFARFSLTVISILLLGFGSDIIVSTILSVISACAPALFSIFNLLVTKFKNYFFKLFGVSHEIS